MGWIVSFESYDDTSLGQVYLHKVKNVMNP